MTDTVLDTDARVAADPRLRRLLESLVRGLDPVAVYLFGSRARGTERADSDYDILLILPDDAPRECMDPMALYDFAIQTKVPADIVPCRETNFDQSRDLVGTLSYEAAHFGKRIYARAHNSAVAPRS